MTLSDTVAARLSEPLPVKSAEPVADTAPAKDRMRESSVASSAIVLASMPLEPSPSMKALVCTSTSFSVTTPAPENAADPEAPADSATEPLSTSALMFWRLFASISRSLATVSDESAT